MAFAYVWYTQLPPGGTFWRTSSCYSRAASGSRSSSSRCRSPRSRSSEERIAGVASGLLNTSQQIGGALGVAIASTIANPAHRDAPRRGRRSAAALTGGYNWAFWVGAVFAFVGLLVAGLILRRSDVPAASEAHATVG